MIKCISNFLIHTKKIFCDRKAYYNSKYFSIRRIVDKSFAPAGCSDNGSAWLRSKYVSPARLMTAEPRHTIP
jgi:hypothetical protein